MQIPISLPLSKSSQVDALRLAIQSCVSAVITYVIMSSFQIPETFLGILSAVLIVSPSIGDTFHQAKQRILSTIIGCLIGFAFVSFIPWGWGTAVSIGVIMFIMNGIAGFKPDWRYGVVGALAVTLGSESDALATSIDRSLAILLGVVIGFAVSFVVWPDRAENRALRHLKRAIKAASRRFEIAVNNTRQKENEDASEARPKYHEHIEQAQRSADAIRFKDPGPIYEQIEQTRKLYNSILILHRVANQAEKDVTDGEAGIENDAMKLKDLACELTKSLASGKQIDDSELSRMSSLAKTMKDDIQNSDEDKHLNALRYTFVFGINEINDSLQALVKSFDQET